MLNCKPNSLKGQRASNLKEFQYIDNLLQRCNIYLIINLFSTLLQHMKKLNVALLIGAPTDEYKGCLGLGRIAFKTLDRTKYNVKTVRLTKERKWLFPKNKYKLLADNLEEEKRGSYITLSTAEALQKMKMEKTDIVFMATVGGYGEDGTLQGFFQFADIPYTGSGILTSALAMDKIKSAEIYQQYRLKIPPYLHVERHNWTKNKNIISENISKNIGFPCIIKPATSGSSFGISIVRHRKDVEAGIKLAFKYSRNILIQEFIIGTELTCAVIDEGGNKPPLVLTPTEVVLKKSKFFDFNSKYIDAEASEEINPARLPKKMIKKIQDAALKAHMALGCTALSRTDMLLNGNALYILETNTIPAMSEMSIYPKIVNRYGITMSRFFDMIIKAGLNRDKNNSF